MLRLTYHNSQHKSSYSHLYTLTCLCTSQTSLLQSLCINTSSKVGYSTGSLLHSDSLKVLHICGRIYHARLLHNIYTGTQFTPRDLDCCTFTSHHVLPCWSLAFISGRSLSNCAWTLGKVSSPCLPPSPLAEVMPGGGTFLTACVLT